MKRYRWLSFFIDTQRNILNVPGLSDTQREIQINQFREQVRFFHGEADLEGKLERWLKVAPPALCTPVAYHELLRETEKAYIGGDFYPALTAACCIGERILNELLISLREDHRSSPHYKKIYRIESIDNWPQAIEILKDWGCINEKVAINFTALLQLRNPSIHYGNITGREHDSLKSLNLIYEITNDLFGMSHPRYFWGPGEMYVKKEYESDPLTKVFILPSCFLVGHKYEIRDVEGVATIFDNFDYPDREISDDEFAMLRKEFKDGKTK